MFNRDEFQFAPHWVIMFDMFEQKLRKAYAVALGMFFLAVFLSQNFCACPVMAGERKRTVSLENADRHEHSCCEAAPATKDSAFSLYEEQDCCCATANDMMEAVLPRGDNQIQSCGAIPVGDAIGCDIGVIAAYQSKAAELSRAPPLPHAVLPAYLRFRALLI
jgi:hypothetical protein